MAYTPDKSYREITETILQQLTKAIVSEKLVFAPTMVRCGLGYKPVRSIVRVEGLLRGRRHFFRPNEDYRLADGMLEWLEAGERPDENTQFYVDYTYGEPSGITDANPGSVARTIVESISREIEYLYAQMDYVYRSGFVDTATGNALDLVVSILGVQRRPAQHAQGAIIFGRNSPPPDVAISAEVFLYDGREQYELRNSPVKEVDGVKGTVNKTEVSFEKGVDYDLVNDSIRWLSGGRRPDALTECRVDYKAFQRVQVPLGTGVSTFARRPEDAKAFETTKEGFLEEKLRGKESTWEAEIPIRAIVPGPEGNILSGSITLMPQPLEGVEFVINRATLTGGATPEGDEELRQRAKRELKALGRATYTSLKQQIEEVEGVIRPVKIEEVPVAFTAEAAGKIIQIPIPGVVKAIVDGGDEKEIRRVIDETRAAGVYVELARPQLVLVDLKVTISLEKKAALSDVEPFIKIALEQYVMSLQIGDDIIFSRLVSTVLGVKGVRDIEEMTVDAYQEGQQMKSTTKENIVLQENEKARLRNVSVIASGGT